MANSFSGNGFVASVNAVLYSFCAPTAIVDRAIAVSPAGSKPAGSSGAWRIADISKAWKDDSIIAIASDSTANAGAAGA